MSELAEKLKTELMRLTFEDREQLADYLIQTLDVESTQRDELAFDAELARRREEIRAGKEVGIPAEQVFKELREKYS